MFETHLQTLTEKKNKLDKFKPFPTEIGKMFDDWMRVELTYNSNAIEGNTLSRIETAEVIEKGVTAIVGGKPLKDQLEALNHAKAIEFVKTLTIEKQSHQLITEEEIKTLHKIILSSINDAWAGRYRETEVFIRGTDVEFPKPDAVPYLVKNFVTWLGGQQENHPVMTAADAHFKYVTIHPFVDGNGRTSRLLMNIILLINGYPMSIIRNSDRTEYLNSLYVAQKENKFELFYNIIIASAERSLDAYLNLMQNQQPDLSVLGGYEE